MGDGDSPPGSVPKGGGGTCACTKLRQFVIHSCTDEDSLEIVASIVENERECPINTARPHQTRESRSESYLLSCRTVGCGLRLTDRSRKTASSSLLLDRPRQQIIALISSFNVFSRASPDMNRSRRCRAHIDRVA